MYLVDTSVWIRFFRTEAASHWFKPEEIGICLPVYQEVLQGVRHDADFHDIQFLLDAAAFFDSPLPKERFADAVQIFRIARRQGKIIRSATDCLIAAIALKHNLTVLHDDRDYAVIASFSGLRERRVADFIS